MSKLLILLTLLVSFPLSAFPLYDREAAPVRFRGGGQCTIVNLGNGYVLTASHCINRIEMFEKKYISIDGSQWYRFTVKVANRSVWYSPKEADGYAVLYVHNPKALLPFKKTRIANEISGPYTIKCFPISYGVPEYVVAHRSSMLTVPMQSDERTIYVSNRDKAIRPGCSGGGLFNKKDELVGVTMWSGGYGRYGIFFYIVPYKSKINKIKEGL